MAEDNITDLVMDMMSSDYNDVSQYSGQTPNDITKNFIKIILDYLKDNTNAIVTYAGTITETGSPDPVIADTIKVKTTNNITTYLPSQHTPPKEGDDIHYNEWMSHIMTNIYNNVYISKGMYLDEPPILTNFFHQSLPGKKVPKSVVKLAYDDDCEDGRLKDGVDIARDCQKALIGGIIDILMSSIGVNYFTQNIAGTSTGNSTITTINII